MCCDSGGVGLWWWLGGARLWLWVEVDRLCS